MNIEDVKQLTDAELDLRIDVDVFKKSESKLRDGWIELGNLATYPLEYCSNINVARKAQAKAIAKSELNYTFNLCKVMGIHDEHIVQVTLYGTISIPHIYIGAVAKMLDASPRQIAMAAYITLQEVQG